MLASFIAAAAASDDREGVSSRDRDAELVAAAALRGDDERAAQVAMEALFQRLSVPLARFARRVGVGDFANDVVTDVFADLWVRRHSLAPAFSPEPYLYRAVRNRALQYLRNDDRARRRDAATLVQSPEPEMAEPAVPDTGSETDVAALVWRAVDTLPESQRTAVTLRCTRALSLAEVATVMELSVPAVKMLLQRAFKTLRLRLAPLLDGLTD